MPSGDRSRWRDRMPPGWWLSGFQGSSDKHVTSLTTLRRLFGSRAIARDAASAAADQPSSVLGPNIVDADLRALPQRGVVGAGIMLDDEAIGLVGLRIALRLE